MEPMTREELVVALAEARERIAALTAERDRLRAACVFALARFCDPHALSVDPAAVRFKEMAEAALADPAPPGRPA